MTAFDQFVRDAVSSLNESLPRTLSTIEICAGAGGQALGLEMAGFHHAALVEIDKDACATLRKNRPNWNVIEQDIFHFCAKGFGEVDLLSGGVPCPPFSIAGKQLGDKDERDLFPQVLRLARECHPKAILIENVRGLLDPKFDNYRAKILKSLKELGYRGEWRLLNASDYGVSQSRQRAILVALKRDIFHRFHWPVPDKNPPVTVGELLYWEIAKLGWTKASEWKEKAHKIAPTIVGGSKKHGGPDLGPTRARKSWAELGVDGLGIANSPPVNGFEGMPRLTTKMVALIQGFPETWAFTGSKTAVYRQVGNAFPPPVAKSLGLALKKALTGDLPGDI